MGVRPVLDYTLNKIWRWQYVILERDVIMPNIHGSRAEREWVKKPRTECSFWWWHTGSGRGGAKELADPERSVDITGGGVVVPLTTDVTELDRVGYVESEDGELLINGPMRIVGMHKVIDHLELYLERWG